MPAWTTNGWTVDNTTVSYWSERDRQHAHLMDTDGNTILSIWDEAVNELVEDGFIKPQPRLHESMADYANHLDLTKDNPLEIQPTPEEEYDETTEYEWNLENGGLDN